MKTKKVVEMHIDRLDKSKFFFLGEENGVISTRDENGAKIMAKGLKISEEAVLAIDEAFDYMRDCLLDELRRDLEDIWKKVNGE